MTGLFTEVFLTALVFGAVTAAIPLLLAGLGEQMSEKAGVLNIGIEGMMLAGAYLGFVVAYYAGSIWLGFLGGAAGGVGGGAADGAALRAPRAEPDRHRHRADARRRGPDGAAASFPVLAQTYPRLPAARRHRIPLLSDIPILGPALFDRPPDRLSRGRAGLRAGLSSIAAPISASTCRRRATSRRRSTSRGSTSSRRATIAVLATGALAGIGGAYLAEVGAGMFVPFMTNGAGFIGIVLAMLARGRPVWVLFGALLFGACLSMTTALQVAGVDIPTDVIQMLPFAAVMAVLVIFGRRASLPAALGIPYVRGAR